MSSRSQPYRRNMPMFILPLIKVATRITLYMVGQTGPTSFVFKDRLGAKHKVSIGSEISCTCQIRVKDHCLHSTYVLLRIFKIPADNPLIWQNSYLDSELTDIVSGKYSQTTPTRPAMSEMFTPSFDFMEPTKILKEEQPLVNRLALGEESECPICQEPMSKQMCLTFCKAGCGNNFHTNCLKIWIQHKQSTEGRVTCPMCRCQYSQVWIDSIRVQEHKYIQEQQRLKIRSMKFCCESCGKKSLTGVLYKCLLCQNYCLCEQCFALKKHIKHPFIKFNGQDWQGADSRKEENKKLKQFLERKRKQKYSTDQIIDKIKRINLQPTKILDFVASVYPYVSQYISETIDPLKKLDFDPQDVECFSCGSKRMMFLRRLPCGHFIDHNCLKQYMFKKKFYCDHDGAKFLKGYENLLKIQDEALGTLAQVPIVEKTEQRRPSLNNYNFRTNQQAQHEEQQAPTLLQALGGFNTLRQGDVSNNNTNRIQQNLTRNIIRAPPRPVNETQIRVRNLSTNARRLPAPSGNTRKRSVVHSNFAVQGLTMRRN